MKGFDKFLTLDIHPINQFVPLPLCPEGNIDFGEIVVSAPARLRWAKGSLQSLLMLGQERANRLA